MVLLGLGRAKHGERMGGRSHVGSSLWQAWRTMAAFPPTQGDFSRFSCISRGQKYVERVFHMDLKYISMQKTLKIYWIHHTFWSQFDKLRAKDWIVKDSITIGQPKILILHICRVKYILTFHY